MTIVEKRRQQAKSLLYQALANPIGICINTDNQHRAMLLFRDIIRESPELRSIVVHPGRFDTSVVYLRKEEADIIYDDEDGEDAEESS